MRHKAEEARRFYSGGYRPSALDEMEFYARLARKTGDKAAEAYDGARFDDMNFLHHFER